jgi:hypothetical protein
MTVAELIALLQTKPQDLQVTYALYSEKCLLEADDIEVGTACKPRPDGWVQDARKDMETQDYLMFP